MQIKNRVKLNLRIFIIIRIHIRISIGAVQSWLTLAGADRPTGEYSNMMKKENCKEII
jgi:hypothetical protein